MARAKILNVPETNVLFHIRSPAASHELEAMMVARIGDDPESQPLVECAGPGIGLQHIKVELSSCLRRRANQIASDPGAKAETLPFRKDAERVKCRVIFPIEDHHETDIAPAMTNQACRLNLELLM